MSGIGWLTPDVALGAPIAVIGGVVALRAWIADRKWKR